MPCRFVLRFTVRTCAFPVALSFVHTYVYAHTNPSCHDIPPSIQHTKTILEQVESAVKWIFDIALPTTVSCNSTLGATSLHSITLLAPIICAQKQSKL